MNEEIRARLEDIGNGLCASCEHAKPHCRDDWSNLWSSIHQGAHVCYYRVGHDRYEEMVTQGNYGADYMRFDVIECDEYKQKKGLFHEYLKSDKWKQKRRERIEADGYKCKMCGSPINLQVHHTTYENVFNESMDDLVTLCKQCHQALHGRREE